MAESSNIAWTDATWNAVIGCSKVSEGCHNCYAEGLALRYKWSTNPWAARFAAENVKLKPQKLDLPLRWAEPKRVFVNSLSDVFHELVPEEYIDRMFAVMAMTPRHTFQILTKRPERQRQYMRDAATHSRVLDLVSSAADWLPISRRKYKPEHFDWPLPNVVLGTSIENNRWLHRADLLRDTPAAVRFISAEPLLGSVKTLDLTNIDQVIVGGESGPGHRPFDMEWAREVRDNAVASGTAFFMKQIGSFKNETHGALTEKDGTCWSWMQEPGNLAPPELVHHANDCPVAYAELVRANPQQELALT